MATFASLMKQTLQDGRIIIKGLEKKEQRDDEGVIQTLKTFFNKDWDNKKTDIIDYFKEQFKNKSEEDRKSGNQFITCIFKYKNIAKWKEYDFQRRYKENLYEKIKNNKDTAWIQIIDHIRENMK